MEFHRWQLGLVTARDAIPGHQRRHLVLNHPDRREDGRHSKANCMSRGFKSYSTGWEDSIWGIPAQIKFNNLRDIFERRKRHG